MSLIYRRTVDQMPADPEEIHDAVAEGVRLVELASPAGLRVEGGRLAGLVCTRTEYRGERDASGRKLPFDVPGSEFEIGLDTLIVAISQHSMLDFFGDRLPELTRASFIAVDPVTFETSIPGVYAGGDVAAHGPSSIVRAAADGKRVAAAIEAAHGLARPVAATAADPIDVHGLVVRRARREYRVPIRVVQPRGAERLRGDDARVHPRRGDGRGLALPRLPHDLQPVRGRLPEPGPDDVRVGADRGRPARARRPRRGDRPPGTRHPFSADQRLQIAVLTDFCNECGNCVTACPTSGSPYRDKPRLYLDRADFLAQPSNAFMHLGDGLMEGRFAGATHRITVDGTIEYLAPGFRALLRAVHAWSSSRRARPAPATEPSSRSSRPRSWPPCWRVCAGRCRTSRWRPTAGRSCPSRNRRRVGIGPCAPDQPGLGLSRGPAISQRPASWLTSTAAFRTGRLVTGPC